MSLQSREGLQVNLQPNSRKQVFRLNGTTYHMNHFGFLMNKVKITNENNETVLEAFPKKWWSSSYILTYEAKEYELKIENKPLATYSIYEKNKLVLSLSLVPEKSKLSSKFEGTLAQESTLFHALLWYLMHPVLQENDALIALLAS